MILDSEIVVNLTAGQKQRTVEVGDMQVSVPPNILITLPSSLPVQFSPSPTTPMLYSAVVDSNVNRVNQVALSTQIMTLAPGYWEISVNVTGTFNWTHIVAAVPDIDVFILIGSQDFMIASMYAQIGTQNRFHSYRFLLRDEATVWHEVGLTGVAANTDSLVFFSANRLL